MNLSEHFTLAELCVTEQRAYIESNHAYALKYMDQLRRLAAGLELVRAHLGHPIHVNSGIRSPALNVAIGGVANSQHVTGLAADFTCPGFGVPYDVARAIAESDIEFDQVIYEYGVWVHISFAAEGATARRKAMSIHSAAIGYVPGIVLKGMA